MNVTSAILAALGVLTSACYGQAGCGYAASYSYSYPTYSYAPVVQQVTKVEKVVVPVYTPVAVPVYQAFYVPGYVPPADMPQKQMPSQAAQAPSGELQQILSAIQGVNNKVDSIDVRLRSVEARTGGLSTPATGGAAAPPSPASSPTTLPPQRQPTAAEGLTVLTNRCGQCHESKVAAKAGKNVVLTNGPNAATLSDRTLVRALKVLGKGTMPPPPHQPLNEQETASLFTLFDSLKTSP